MAGRRCAALDTFEAMLASGCRPHAAVYSSIIDVLWQTGIAWAQAKALRLFTTAVQCAPLPALACSTCPSRQERLLQLSSTPVPTLGLLGAVVWT